MSFISPEQVGEMLGREIKQGEICVIKFVCPMLDKEKEAFYKGLVKVLRQKKEEWEKIETGLTA